MGRRALPSSSGGLNRYIAYLVLATLAVVVAGCADSRSAADDDAAIDDTASSTAPPSATPTANPTEAEVAAPEYEEVVREPDEDEETPGKPKPEPTESPAEEDDKGVSWIRYENDEHGYTLEHPEGWIVGPPMHGSQHLVNDDRACAKCEDGTPSGTVLMHITPVLSPPSAPGEPFTVAGGIKGQISYGGFAGDQDPERVFDIHYSTLGTDWWIYAFFGDPIDDDNELATQVFELIESIRHRYPPSLPTPEPIPDYELIQTWTGVDRPTGISVETTGHVYIADTGNNRVVKVTPDGEPVYQIEENSQYAALDRPTDVSVGDADGTGFVVVIDSLNSWINLHMTQGPAFNGWGWDRRTFITPRGVVMDRAGLADIYVTVEHSITKFSLLSDPKWESEIGGELWGITLDNDGYLLVADRSGGRIVKVGWQGQVVDTWYGFSQPMGVAVDPWGNVYVAENGANRVVRLNSQGVPLDQVGGPELFDSPRGVAVDDNGKIYVSDNATVKIFKPQWTQ
jgi:sugar lactone lactonase YvrE